MTTKLQSEFQSLDRELISNPAQNSENSHNHPFPLDMLPPVMKSIVKESASMAQVPPSLAAMVAFGCISTAVGGGLCIQSNHGRTLNANVFILAVAKSGTGKGQVCKAIAMPLEDRNAELFDEWESALKPMLEGDKKALLIEIKAEEKKITDGGNPDGYSKLMKELAAIDIDLEKPPKILVGEVPEERLGMIISGQPHEAIGCHSAEARGIVDIIMGKYSKDATGETLYLAGYSGDRHSVERVSRPDLCLRNPCISVMFMIQPDKLRKLTTSDAMTESGFLPRFLLADVKADFEDDPDEDLSITEDTMLDWKQLIDDLLDLYRESKEKRIVAISTEAAKMLRDESNRVGRLAKFGESLEKYSSYLFRYGENLRKIHLLIHCAEHGEQSHKTIASEQSAKNAITIARWFHDESMKILMEGQANKMQGLLQRLVKIINSEKSKEITMGVLKKSHTISEQDITELQELFPGVIDVEDRKSGVKGGRPTMVVKLAG